MATIAECLPFEIGAPGRDSQSGPGPRTECAVRSLEIGGRFAETSAGELADWCRVFDRDAAAPIFADPNLVLLEASAAFEQHQRRAMLFHCRQGGEPRAAAALLPKELRIPRAGWIGQSSPLRGYVVAGKQCLVAAPEFENGDAARYEPALTELLCAAANSLRPSRSDFVLFEDLEPAGPLWDALRQLDRRRFRVVAPNGFQERLRIRLPRSAGEYWSQFTSKTRSTFRRKLKKLGQVSVERIASPQQVPEFLQAAHEISRNTWQSERLGLRVRNDDAERRLFGMLAEKGAVRSYLLRKDGRPVAFLIGNQYRGYFNYEEVGFDRDFAEQSPGQVLLVQVLEDLFEHDPPEWFDFGGGDAAYKRQFANHRSTSGNVWVVPRTLRLELILGYLATCRRADRAARTMLAKTGLLTRLRQMVRRKTVAD